MHCYVQFDKNTTQNYTAKRIFQVLSQPLILQVEENKEKPKIKPLKRKTPGAKGNRSN